MEQRWYGKLQTRRTASCRLLEPVKDEEVLRNVHRARSHLFERAPTVPNQRSLATVSVEIWTASLACYNVVSTLAYYDLV